jgi:predicted transcriptional regulator
MKTYNPKYVDRLMFINEKGSKYIIFENNDYQVTGMGKVVLFKNEPLINV